jgi:hypothetical protein
VTGSIQYHKERKLYYVQWYDRVTKKTYKIYKYRGEYLYDIRLAEKLLACMQADVENDTFRIEKYKGDQWTDVIPYLEVWLETVKATLSPATLKDYQNSIKNHLVPFFRKNPAQLHEIQYDLLLKLLNFIPRSGTFTAVWFSLGVQGVFRRYPHSLKKGITTSSIPRSLGYPKTDRLKLSKRYRSFTNRYFGF